MGARVSTCRGRLTNMSDVAEISTWETTWSQAQKDFCCASMGRGCATIALPETTPTVPPTPFPTQPPTPPPTPPPTAPPTLPPTLPPFVPPTAPPGPVDPFNCAVGQYPMW